MIILEVEVIPERK